ncbi:putative Ubiquinol--cytochrome-c reductase [Zostera marina]|uniref:Cytochrome b-c1 complex subunit 6 n=1 Tax=Zostera marina TaxID=29655 RepID=A0A0K9PRL7_ZOSMR|nr:putative Ubiquinol--cytochrome-c reductase [Zostera marina]
MSDSDFDPVDPKALLEDRCKSKCVKTWVGYVKCAERIKDDESGSKHCTGQYFDYYSCIDKCVALLLFKELK